MELSGGLRYTDDDKTYQGTVLNLFPATLPDPDPLPTKATSEGGPLFIFNRPFDDGFSALTGSASVRYSWSDEFSTYASYARSFKSGGFNTRYNALPQAICRCHSTKRRSTATRSAPKSTWGISVSTPAAFIANYSNIQLIFRQGVVPLLFNAGKARIKGIEAEISYRSRSGLVFDALCQRAG